MRGRTHPRYLLGLLLIIAAFNGVDGQALGLVLQAIKNDLTLTDTQLGVLTGLAFALFYSVMGLPIARWSDRGNRVVVIAASTVVWSIAVSACGIAKSFAQLLGLRVIVASGEAGCLPPAHSLMADYFSRAERPRAVGIYLLSAPLSAILGYLAAGWLNEFYGWRVMFVVLGLPGAALGIIAWLTLREPRKGQADVTGARFVSISSPAPPLREVMTTLSQNRTFRHLLYSFSVLSFFGAGLAQWLPTFLIRTYHLKTGELGSWLSVIWGASGALGTYFSGQWASRRAAGNEQLQLRVIAVACGVAGILWILMYLSPALHWALAFMLFAGLGFAVTSAPLFATLQTLVPGRMRAISISIFYLCSNLVGGGLGPLVVGVLSDLLRPLVGANSLRYALIAMCPGYLWCAWHLVQASRTVRADVAAVLLDQEAASRSAQALSQERRSRSAWSLAP